jgi:hypothetical protein
LLELVPYFLGFKAATFLPASCHAPINSWGGLRAFL